MYTCIYIYIYIHTYIYIYLYIHVGVGIYIYIYVCILASDICVPRHATPGVGISNSTRLKVFRGTDETFLLAQRVPIPNNFGVLPGENQVDTRMV